ncbi:MAG: hypothetical protein Q7R94_00335 [bacterium]|nr:hypothetical protein [bacterium]
MQKTLLLLVLVVVLSCGQVFAQDSSSTDKQMAVVEKANKAKQPSTGKFSLEFSAGSFNFPGALLEKEGSLVAHPKKLSGFITSVSANHRFGKSGWSLGPEFSFISASGAGKWAESDTQARLDSEGVTGTTTGTLKLRIYELNVVATKEFCRGSFCPYIKFGAGIGRLSYDFRGRFNGHETQSGFDFPINEPAYDRSKRFIPIFVVEPGVRLKRKHITFSFSPFYWNTGWGGKGTLTLDLGAPKPNN